MRLGRHLLWSAAFLAVILLAACGGGESSADGSNGRSRSSSTQEKGSQRRLPASTCTAATVQVGEGSDSIDFTVVCRAKPRGAVVGFSISRKGFRNFSRHPSVGGPGSKHRYGSCVRQHNRPIACQAEIDGKVVISGRLRVDPRGRCSVPISITVNENSGCNGKVCPLALVIRQIFDGLPRGC
jgi:hypothetical protein